MPSKQIIKATWLSKYFSYEHSNQYSLRAMIFIIITDLSIK